MFEEAFQRRARLDAGEDHAVARAFEQLAGIFARMIGRTRDHQLGGTIRPFIGVDQVVQAFFGNEARDGEQEISVRDPQRSEEHTSELQSLMRISYAVFCLKKKKQKAKKHNSK